MDEEQLKIEEELKSKALKITTVQNVGLEVLKVGLEVSKVGLEVSKLGDAVNRLCVLIEQSNSALQRSMEQNNTLLKTLIERLCPEKDEAKPSRLRQTG